MMFQVYGLQGRVFTGTLDEWRRLPAASAVARTRRVGAVTHPAEETAADAGWTGQTTAGRQALAEYDAVAHPKERRVLALVADVMRAPAHTVQAGTIAGDAWQLLVRLGIGQAPVVDEAGALQGMIGLTELMPPGLAAGSAMSWADWQARLGRPVAEVMWTPVPSVSPGTDLRQVASVLVESGLPGLPVADEQGRVTGFVSRADLLRALAADPPLDLWS